MELFHCHAARRVREWKTLTLVGDSRAAARRAPGAGIGEPGGQKRAYGLPAGLAGRVRDTIPQSGADRARIGYLSVPDHALLAVKRPPFGEMFPITHSVRERLHNFPLGIICMDFQGKSRQFPAREMSTLAGFTECQP